MKINTNRWNKIRYTLYVPFYDLIGKVFSKSRKKSIEALEIQSEEKILLIGAGTGLDIQFIPSTAQVTATDITPAMIGQIEKNKHSNVEALVMDGQQLEFPDDHFDKIILHLILAVIPDPVGCIKEAERVLKPGGKIAIFDKFLDDEEEPSFIRKFLNLIARTFFSDINRRFADIIKHTKLQVISQNKADFGGNFKIIMLVKK